MEKENMNKIISLALIALFALSILPLAFEVKAQTSSPVQVTTKIDSGDLTLISDDADVFFAKSNPSSPDLPSTAKVKPAPQPKSYALTIEIDYIEGHAPTQAVLNYIQAYYASQNIAITFDLANQNEIPFTAALSDGVSDAEFWALEAQYNDGLDNAVNSENGEYLLPLKWVLYGTSVEGSSDVVGYTYCVGTFRDLVAGNYIFIADGAADAWADEKGVQQYGAEAVLLMHEFGHSVGICVVRAGGEVYCSDYYCVMSYLRPQNAGNLNHWYYCSTHWKTKNIEYYIS
jgi:hypothetical protein